MFHEKKGRACSLKGRCFMRKKVGRVSTHGIFILFMMAMMSGEAIAKPQRIPARPNA